MSTGLAPSIRPTTLCAICWLTTSKVLSTFTVTTAFTANGGIGPPLSARALSCANVVGEADNRNSKNASSAVKFGVTGNCTFCTVVKSAGMGAAGPRPRGKPPTGPRAAVWAAATAA